MCNYDVNNTIYAVFLIQFRLVFLTGLFLQTAGSFETCFDRCLDLDLSNVSLEAFITRGYSKPYTNNHSSQLMSKGGKQFQYYCCAG